MGSFEAAYWFKKGLCLEQENYFGRHGGDMTKTPGVSVLKSAKGLISATRTDVDSKDQVTKFVRNECLPQLKKLIQEGGNIVSIVDLNRQNNVKTMNELNSSKASIHS